MKKVEMGKKYRFDGLDHKYRVVCVDRASPVGLHVLGLFKESPDGQEFSIVHDEYGNPADGWGMEWKLVEITEWDDFKIDDKVLVSMFNDVDGWVRGYFAGVNDAGEPTTFYDGATSWSNGHSDDRCAWKYCKKPDGEENG